MSDGRLLARAARFFVSRGDGTAVNPHRNVATDVVEVMTAAPRTVGVIVALAVLYAGLAALLIYFAGAGSASLMFLFILTTTALIGAGLGLKWLLWPAVGSLLAAYRRRQDRRRMQKARAILNEEWRRSDRGRGGF